MGKRFYKVSLLFLIAGCLFAGPSSSGQEQELWRTDWLKFGEAIAPYAKQGALELKGDFWEFNRIFSQEVEWTGTLKKFHDNGVAKHVALEMQPLRVALSDGSVLELKELPIWCSVQKSGCNWSPELVGKEVVFRTKLINRTRGYRPVVGVANKGEKDQRARIEAYGAELIRVISK
ncbi:MAG TPA: hypothetical protein VFZ40_08170 [Pyrinomonadaceae bacterium]